MSHGALTLSSCHTFLIIGINFGHSIINPIFSNSMNEDAQTGSLRHPRRVCLFEWSGFRMVQNVEFFFWFCFPLHFRYGFNE